MATSLSNPTSPPEPHAARDPQGVRSALDRDGFALVTDVFDAGDIAEARALMDELLERGMAADDGLRSRSGRMFVQDMAAPGLDRVDQPEILYPATLDPRLLETRLFTKLARLARALSGSSVRSFDHVIVKPASNRTETHWHQDIVLSRLDRLPRWPFRKRLHFWVPLQEVSASDGCMEFIAGSHREAVLPHHALPHASGASGLATTPRGGRHVVCPVPLGGLTIHTPWTLHCTAPNRNTRPRVAWIVHFSPTGGVELALKRGFGRLPQPLPPSA